MRVTWALIGAVALAAIALTAIVFCNVADVDARATYVSAIVGFAGVIVTLLSQSLIQEYSEQRKICQLRKSIHVIILGNCLQLEQVLPLLIADLRSGKAISIPRGQTRFALSAIQQHVADLTGDAPSSDFVALAHFVDNTGFMILSSTDLTDREAVEVHDNFFVVEPAAIVPAERVFDHIVSMARQLREITERGDDIVDPPARLEM